MSERDKFYVATISSQLQCFLLCGAVMVYELKFIPEEYKDILLLQRLSRCVASIKDKG